MKLAILLCALACGSAFGQIVLTSGSQTAVPYPDGKVVSGFAGPLDKVEITLEGVTSDSGANAAVLLESPDGETVVLFHDVFFGDVNNAFYTFSDTAPQLFEFPFASGTYLPTNGNTQADFPSPAPASPYADVLSVFNGGTANGTWRLYLADSFQEAGTIISNWTLQLYTSPTIAPIAPQTTPEDVPLNVPFTIGHPTEDLDTMTLVAESSGPVSLQVEFFGSGANRTATITPMSDSFGLNTVTIYVISPASDLTNSATFDLDITPVNDLPTFGTFGNTIDMGPGDQGSFFFTVSDIEDDASDLVVSATSDNQALIPDANIRLEGAGSSERYLYVYSTGPNTGTATVTLTLADLDGGEETFDVTVTVNPPNGDLFANVNPIDIVDDAPANPYPSTIEVSGLGGTLQNLVVMLAGLTHENADDLDILLVSPSGEKVMLMSDAGGNNTLDAIRLKIARFSEIPLPDDFPIFSQTYTPADYEPGESLPLPAPAAPYQDFDQFTNSTLNGTWSLYILDDTFSAASELESWMLLFQTFFPPNITTPPATLTALQAGEPFDLTVTAEGAQPLNYQWLKNGEEIPDATNSTFNIASVANVDAAIYTVAVSNNDGTNESSQAVLIVADWPDAVEGVYGNTAQFSVSATSPQAVSYQWQHEGVNLFQANSPTYTTPPFDRSLAGAYRVLLTTEAGTVASPDAGLAIPANTSTNFFLNSTNEVFLVEAEDFNHSGGFAEPEASTMPLAAGLYSGFAAVEDVDYHTLDDRPQNDFYRSSESPNVPILPTDDYFRGSFSVASNYRLVDARDGEWFTYTRDLPPGTYAIYAALSRESGSIQAGLALLDDPAAPSDTNRLGTFFASPTGKAGVNDLVPLVNGQLQPVVIALDGTVHFRLLPESGVDSVDVDYLVFANLLPTISVHPQSAVGSFGQNHTFTVSAEQAETYRWFLNGNEIDGANGPSYTAIEADDDDRGVYTVEVSNPYGTVTSDPAVLWLGNGWTTGLIKREVYSDNIGNRLEHLYADPAFPEQPDLITFESSLEAPADFDDFYGQALSGLILAPITGNYTFYLSSDAQARLFLSTNESPANLRPIALEPSNNSPRDWTSIDNRPESENISLSIFLEAGHAYRFLVLMKEQLGSDHVAVAWQKPGDGIPSPGSPPIGSEYLAYDPEENDLPPYLLVQPAGGTFYAGDEVMLTVAAGGAYPLAYQWEHNGQDLIGETSAALRITAEEFTSGDYRVRVSNYLDTNTSSIATINVTPEVPAEVGPVFFNGNYYYLLSHSSWGAARHTAFQLGGHLVTINSQAENDFVTQTFSDTGDPARRIWIGLFDTDRDNNSSEPTTRETEFAWSSGEPVIYTNWEAGQPDFSVRSDFAAEIWTGGAPGTWNDTDQGFTGLQYGVVEVPGTRTFSISIGSTVAPNDPDEFAGNLAVAGAVHVYEFIGNPGDHIFFDDLGASECCLEVTGVDPSGDVFLVDVLDAGAPLMRRLMEEGTYRLEVRAQAVTPSAKGPFSFRLRTAPQPNAMTYHLNGVLSHVAGPDQFSYDGEPFFAELFINHSIPDYSDLSVTELIGAHARLFIGETSYPVHSSLARFRYEGSTNAFDLVLRTRVGEFVFTLNFAAPAHGVFPPLPLYEGLPVLSGSMVYPGLSRGEENLFDLTGPALTSEPGAPRLFGPATISIIDNATADPYPSSIFPSELPGAVFGVAVTIDGLSHDNTADLDVLLEAPNGQTVLLMSDAGGDSSSFNSVITFQENDLPFVSNESLDSGFFQPTNYGTEPDPFPAPAAAGPYSTILSSLDGGVPIGEWKLYVVDDAPGGTGIVTRGWYLAVQTTPLISDLESFATFTDTPVSQSFYGIHQAVDPVPNSFFATWEGDDVLGPVDFELAQDGTNIVATFTPLPGITGTNDFALWYLSRTEELFLVGWYPATVSAPPNTAPAAADVSFTVNEDGTLVEPAPGILANTTDNEMDPLTAVLVTGPASGSLSLNSDGSFTYSPNPNYFGPDSFTFKASDGALESETATANISVNSINDVPSAKDDGYTTSEDTPLSIAAPGVLGNDSDVEGSSLTASVTAGPSNGSLTLNSDGSFTYTPAANFFGTDSFTYIANDGADNSLPGTVQITVTGINDPPVAVANSYSANEDTTLAIPAPGVLANDSDTEGSTLTAVLVSGPANGSLTLNPDGSFTYQPAADYNGADSFTYRASDGSLTSSATLVSLDVLPVNDAPVAVANSYSLNEDTPLAVPAPGILGNDSDIEGSALTAVIASGPSNGSLSLNASGSFTYTPNANFFGSDTFTYRANDGLVDSAIAAVNLTVNPVNDPPAAASEAFATGEDTPLTISAPGVLANDFDPEGATLSAVLVSSPSNGSFGLNANGSFSYTPALNFTGTATFSYRVSDGSLLSEPVVTSISVIPINDTPQAASDSYSLLEDTTLNVPVRGLLANDFDIDGDPLSAILVTGPANGSLALNLNGSFSYTPNANFHGSDTFTYRVSDGPLESAPAAVTLTVQTVNDSPVAVNNAYLIDEDTVLNIAAPGVLENDSDADGDALNALLVTGPTRGTLSLSANGAFQYTPTANFNGSDSFTYRASDGVVPTPPVLVTITVAPVNDAPIVSNDSYSVDEDGTLVVPVSGILANDSDAEGQPLTAALETNPSRGTVVFGADGSFTYTPNRDYSGSDSFTYRASDGIALSSVATVALNVIPINDGPVAANDNYSVAEDTLLNISAPGVLANDTDADTESLSALLVTGPANGTLTLSPSGSFTYQPTQNFVGADSFTYRASDAVTSSGAVLVTIQVTPVNDAPAIEPIADVSFREDESSDPISIEIQDDSASSSLILFVRSSDPDLFGDNGFIMTGGGQIRTLVLNPAPDRFGSATITVQVSDGEFAAQRSFTANVLPVNDPPVISAIANKSTPPQVPIGPIPFSVSDLDSPAESLIVSVDSSDKTLVPVLNIFSAGTGEFRSLDIVPAAGRSGISTISLTVQDSEGASATTSFDLIVSDAPLLILTHPESRNTGENSRLEFNVVARGADPLAFQWFFNGAPIPEATNNLLVLNDVQLAAEGSYLAEVSSPDGTLRSREAILRVSSGVVIARQPVSRVASPGETVTYSVEAYGAEPLTFQWFQNNRPIAGADSPTLVLPNVEDPNIGDYRVKISNQVGELDSSSASLALIDAIRILNEPLDQSVNAGQPVLLRVQALSSSRLSYRWFFGGIPLPGATGPELRIASAEPDHQGNYTVEINNGEVARFSRTARVQVTVGPEITRQPSSQTILAGAATTFSVVATGSEPLTYEWFRNGVSLSIANTPDFILSNVTPEQEGRYTVRVSNASGAVLSEAAVLTVDDTLRIASQPVSLTRAAGTEARFQVGAFGDVLQYQWFFRGLLIPGANSSELVIPAVTVNSAGNYAVEVRDTTGAILSSNAVLAVVAPPAITVPPLSQNAALGGRVELAVIVSGSEPLSYVWTHNGETIEGVNGPVLVLNNIEFGEAGEYRVHVQNPAGAADSEIANIRVIRAVEIVQPPANLRRPANATATFNVAATGDGPIEYQWLFNGFDIPGATAASFSIQNVTPDQQGVYSVRVSNSAGDLLSGDATLDVIVPPTITSQPASLSLKVGETALFEVAVSGTPPFTYQWQRNGVDIPGATSETFAILNAQEASQGTYSVLVSGEFTSVMSSPASLQILSAPVIVLDPLPTADVPGVNLLLSVVAQGTPPLSYQWAINGVNVPGATSPTYPINSARPADGGTYTVTVSNSGGVATSRRTPVLISAASLDFADNRTNAPLVQTASASFSGHNLDATAEVGEPDHAPTIPAGASVWMAWRSPDNGLATFNTAGSGFDTILAAYILDGQSNLVQQASDEDGGNYLTSIIRFNARAGVTYYLAIDGFNRATGNLVLSWTLEPAEPGLPIITRQPIGYTALLGGFAEFSVGAQSTDGGSIGYQWYKFDQPVPGANSAGFRIDPATVSDVDRYFVRVFNTADESLFTDSLPVALQVNLIETGFEGPDVTWADKLNVAGLPPITTEGLRAQRLRLLQSVARGFVGSTAITTRGSQREPGEPDHCNNLGFATEWALYQAPASGLLLVTTEGTSFDTVLAIYSGSYADFGSLQLLACDNDSGADGKTSRLTIPVTEGQTYSIVVDSADGSSGVVLLSYALSGPPVLVEQPRIISSGLQPLAVGGAPAGSTVSLGVIATNPFGETPLLYQWSRNGQEIPGATESTLTLPGLNSSHVGRYTVAVRNFAGTVVSEAFDLSLVSGTSIVTPPQSQTVSPGASAIFTVEANSSGRPRYQWHFNGTPIDGATTSTLVIHNAQPASQGVYMVRVSNTENAVTAEATLTVQSPISITSQPAPVSVAPNGFAQFRVTAAGSGLSYQWRFNGVNIPGANSTEFNLSGVDASRIGSYSVVVSNSQGSVVSQEAALQLVAPILITSDPRSLTIAGASTAEFEVIASGSEPITYQWRFNGTPIPNATERVLRLSNLAPANAGLYSVQLSNAAGSVVSESALLTLAALPIITQQPASQNLLAGDNLALAVAATGTGPLFYQWRFNGIPIEGATASSLAINNITAAAEGTYSVSVENAVGSTLSDGADVLVRSIPVVTFPPTSQTVVAGSAVNFSVAAIGTAPFSYQWLKNGAPIPGATQLSLVLTNVQNTDVAVYGVRITNPVGSVDSPNAALTVQTVPEILSMRGSHSVDAGEDTSFDVIAIGTRTLRYQWKRNGAPIPGATNTVLELPETTAADAGDYSVTVSNDAGTVHSSVSHLAVDRVVLTPARVSGNFVLNLSGPNGRQTVVESTTDLQTWTVVGTVVFVNGQATFQQPILPGLRYFRTRLLP